MVFIFFCYLCIMKYIILLLFTFYSFAQESKISIGGGGTPNTIDPVTNCELRYYYFPNMQMYYDFKTATYIYMINGTIMESIEKPQCGYSHYNDYYVKITDYDGDDIINCLEKHKILYPYVSSKRPRMLKTKNI